MTDTQQDAAGETWEVTTTGGPIKYVRGNQEFDLSRVVGRRKMRDYLNALTREVADLRRENEALAREAKRIELIPRRRRTSYEHGFLGWIANADGLGRDYLAALVAHDAAKTGGQA